ncbi:uncharacterized protein [Euphorbia lathyris]|uniref:uncharacterized protein n=1 Tax=Euphorbia lathyris TaxID=212925 RepID=UPI0033139DF3
MNSPINSEKKDHTFPDEVPILTTEDGEKQQKEDQTPPQSQNPQSPKTQTLEIPDADEPNPKTPPAGDPNQGDREEITVVSPTISDSHISSPTTLTFARRGFGGGGGGGGGRRRMKRNFAQEKKSQQKLEILAGTLKPVPFVPVRTLDLSSHEAVLRRLGLWDFAHLDFDFKLHRDLILQLIASFSPQVRASKVNEVRIKVSRPDLARALCLPVKKEKMDNAMEVKESEESVSFIEEFVSTFLLLQEEDPWLMPDEIHNTMNMIREGNFDKVDFAKLIWIMVEKELANPELGNCYYASHLQLLIKSQREDILKEQENVKMEIDIKEDEEEEEEVVKTSEEQPRGTELEEHNIELSLGGSDNAVKDDGIMESKEQEKVNDDGDDGTTETKEKVKDDCITKEKEKEQSVGDYNDAMDFEESKEEDDEQGQWQNTTMDGHFLQPCNFSEVGLVECEERKQEEEGEEEEEEEEGQEGEYQEAEEEEEEEGEMVFGISPNDVANSESLIAAIEASENPFSSGMQSRHNVSSVEFLTSRVETGQTAMPGGSSPFNNGNGSKRAIGHLENDMHNHSLNGGNKRMRSDGHWDNLKSASEFDMYMDQMQHVMAKARMSYDAKEQEYQNLSMQHQMLLSELDHRNNVAHNLYKAKMEEQRRRQVETGRLEHELHMMGNLLEGYRKALKETTKAFAEYRKKCPLSEEPLYKDTGSGGLVLSTSELEKLRLKQEEEKRQECLLNIKKIKEFEAHFMPKFEQLESYVEGVCDRLRNVEKEVNLLKEGIAKHKKAAEMSECAPFEEQEMTKCAPSEEQEMSKCAPSEEQEMTKCAPSEEQEMSKCAPSEEQEMKECAPSEEQEMKECAPSEEQEMKECAPSEEQEMTECAPTEEQEMTECAPSEEQEKTECAPSEEEQVTQQSV